MMSRFLGIKAQVSLETLRELLTSEGTTSQTAPGDKTFDMAGANDTKYLPLPDIAKGEVQQDVSTAGAGSSACRHRR